MAATELKYDRRNFGRTTSIPREDAYLIALPLRACHDHDLYFDGRLTRPRNWFACVTSIYDFATRPGGGASRSVSFHHVPSAAKGAGFHDPRSGGAARRRSPPRTGGVSVDDPVVRSLLASLLPAMAKPEEAHPLFLDHVA